MNHFSNESRTEQNTFSRYHHREELRRHPKVGQLDSCEDFKITATGPPNMK